MLAPARLRLPHPLAQGWPAVLARAGVEVVRTGRRAVLGTRGKALVVHVDEAADGSVCSLELVTDTAWRRRLEAVFLGSGAALEDPADITPVVRALYRASEAQWSALQAGWLRDGAVLDLPGPWASAQAFPAGELQAYGARLALETGPALAPDGSWALYVDLLPRFFGLRPGRALLALIQKTQDQLLRAGAVAVHGLDTTFRRS
ncbi:MAG: hypothetical protein V4864_04400 [Pseudomonadota bacterium]